MCALSCFMTREGRIILTDYQNFKSEVNLHFKINEK